MSLFANTDSTVIYYTYNADGIRTGKQYLDAGGGELGTVKYTLDGNKIVAEQRGNTMLYYTADINHSFPYFVDTFVDFNSGRPLIGGDGVARNFIELPGNINGIPGVFEYIIEPNGLCNHHYFRNLR